MKQEIPPFKIGDRVRVVKVPPSVEQQMPEETRSIFQKCVGKVFRVDGFDEYGHLELNLISDGSQASSYREHTIWIEPEYVELISSQDRGAAKA